MSAINTQFSVGVHIMTALGFHSDKELVSKDLTESVNADPSFIRAVLAKLSKAGLVNTSRGRNGHCEIAKPANKITLLDIYNAIESPKVFALHSYPEVKECLISSTHKKILGDVLQESQNLFEKSLSEKYLSELVEKIRE